jgi:hypothetical protein
MLRLREAALAEDLAGKGKSLRLAMNGGMYRSDFRPVGLYIENGRELAPANTKSSRMGFSTWGTTKQVFSRPAGFSPKAKCKVRHPVRADARRRRCDPPGFHRWFNRSQASEWCRRVEPTEVHFVITKGG